MTMKGKGAGNPPIAADDVRKMLLDHLGDNAPIDFIRISVLVRLLNKTINTGELPSSGGLTIEPNTRRFYEAIRTIEKFLPTVLRTMQATVAEFRARAAGRPKPELDGYEEMLERMRRLSAAVNDVMPGVPSVRRKHDSRSEWHPTARLFASLIEAGYQEAGTEPPTRHSLASPLVLAVQALLKRIGQQRDEDAIRQALGKYRD